MYNQIISEQEPKGSIECVAGVVSHPTVPVSMTVCSSAYHAMVIYVLFLQVFLH